MELVILIPLGFLVLGFLLEWKLFPAAYNTAQKSPYECGFSPFQSARRPFSIYFFLVALLFLVFDLEVILLSPLPLVLGLGGVGYFMVGGFLLVLVLGLFHEWREGSLEWAE